MEPEQLNTETSAAVLSRTPMYLWAGAIVALVALVGLLWGLGIVGANADYICTKITDEDGPCTNGSWGSWENVSNRTEGAVTTAVQRRVYTGVRSTSRTIQYLSGRTQCQAGYQQQNLGNTWHQKWSGFHGGNVTVSGVTCQIEQTRTTVSGGSQASTTVTSITRDTGEQTTVTRTIETAEQLAAEDSGGEEGEEGTWIGDASASIQAKPTLVRTGGTSLVTWRATGVQSCAVTSTGGDSWPGITGSETSRPIQQQTIFTLTCPLRGGDELTATARVNIVPEFSEQ